MTDQLTDDEIGCLKSLGTAARLFTSLTQSIPASAVVMFTAIATKEGKSVRNYSNFVDVGFNNASRTISDLSDTNRYGGAGLGLISKAPGNDAREAICHLTPKGRAFARRVANAIAPVREAA